MSAEGGPGSRRSSPLRSGLRLVASRGTVDGTGPRRSRGPAPPAGAQAAAPTPPGSMVTGPTRPCASESSWIGWLRPHPSCCSAAILTAHAYDEVCFRNRRISSMCTASPDEGSARPRTRLPGTPCSGPQADAHDLPVHALNLQSRRTSCAGQVLTTIAGQFSPFPRLVDPDGATDRRLPRRTDQPMPGSRNAAALDQAGNVSRQQLIRGTPAFPSNATEGFAFPELKSVRYRRRTGCRGCRSRSMLWSSVRQSPSTT